MPGSVKVKVLSARNLPVMNRLSLLTDAFVEICIGNITHRTDVVKRSLNPCWNSDWYIFELDDQALQEEALLLKVMDHDTYSSHDTIGRVYFDLNPLLGHGHTRCLNGWFPIYDTMHGIRGEISLAVRVDVFLDASRYKQSSLGVRFFHCHTVPQGYIVKFFIGFIQELIMSDDPEYQWIEKLRTSRASNEARQRLFSRLSGELQRKMGIKVMNLGGNSVIGYQLHFDLEGETGVVVRGIGTAVCLKQISQLLTPPNSPMDSFKLSSSIGESTMNSMDSVHYSDGDGTFKISQMSQSFSLNGLKPLELGEFPFLTVSQLLPALILHMGSIVSSKSVKLLDKNTPDGTQFRASWWFELRTEIAAHMVSADCDAVIAYREECTIYEDVCILSAYGTAVRLNAAWTHQKLNMFKNLLPTHQKMQDKVSQSCIVDSPARTNSNSVQSELINSSHFVDRSVIGMRYKSSHANDATKLQNLEADHDLFASPLPFTKFKTSTTTTPDCHICHLPVQSTLNSTPAARCAICKAAYVPDILLSSTDFPPELHVTGNPALIQARICRSKKDAKGEIAANELSELLPFIDYELHYRLVQKLRLRGMNGLFGLRFNITVGDYMIAAIATGTGVFITALPPLPPPKVVQVSQNTNSHDDQLFRLHLRKRINDYLHQSKRIFKIPDFPTIVQHDSTTDSSKCADTLVNSRSFDVDECLRLQSPLPPSSRDDASEVPLDTLFLDSREPEPEELAILLDDPLQPSDSANRRLIFFSAFTQPCHLCNSVIEIRAITSLPLFTGMAFSGFTLTTTESLPMQSQLTQQHVSDICRPSFDQLTSFVRFHEVHVSIADSFYENLGRRLSVTESATALIGGQQQQHFWSRSQTDDSAGSQSKSDSLSTTDCHAANHNNKCLSQAMSEFNQLTWFRFRKCVPCIINALNYRLTFTDDDHIQILATGMILVPPLYQNELSKAPRVAAKSSDSSVPMLDSIKINAPAIRHMSANLEVKDEKVNGENDKTFSGCLLTPLSVVPGTFVESYLGNLDFFFIRETTDLREDGGVCGFLHASLTEVQAVVGAHTASLGGNALLSYHLSEVQVLKPASRNQAQCLLNVCGDMARLAMNKVGAK